MRDAVGPIWFVIKTMLGLVLVLGGVAILYRPEASNRKAFLTKDEFASSAVTVKDAKIDKANQGKPVVVTGQLTAKSLIEDKDLGAKLPGAIVAYREVAMCQNDEVWRSTGEDEVLSGHKLVWSDEPYSCPSKPNPPFPLASKVLMASDYRVGDFSIPKEMAAEIQGRAVRLPSLKLGENLARLGKWELQTKYYSVTRKKSPGRVGDLRVRYLVSEPTLVTVLGVQQGDRIEPFIDASGNSTYAIIKGQSSPSVVKRSSGGGGQSLVWTRLLSFFPLWLGFGILISAKMKEGSGCGAGLFFGACVAPFAMVAVHLAVWYVMPRLVL